jgi:hypothetical protein
MTLIPDYSALNEIASDEASSLRTHLRGSATGLGPTIRDVQCSALRDEPRRDRRGIRGEL